MMPWDNINKPWVVEEGDIENFEAVLCGLSAKFPDEPLHILEWGAGGSCIHYPKFLRENLEHPHIWFAMEHDPAVKHDRLGGLLDPFTFVCLAQVHPWRGPTEHQKVEWDKKFEGWNTWYVQAPGTFVPANGYHLIYVDGVYRYSCLKLAQKLLRDDGVLLMDNADRADKKFLAKEFAFKGEFVKPHWYKATLATAHPKQIV